MPLRRGRVTGGSGARADSRRPSPAPPGRLAPRPAPDARLRAVHPRSASSSRSGLSDRLAGAAAAAAGTSLDIAAWAVPFGIVGGRLYHVITTPEPYFGPGGDPVEALYDLAGRPRHLGRRRARRRSAPASAAGGTASRCRRSPTRWRPGIALAQAIGRFGNWFNQELYGRPTTLPWGLRDHHGPATGHAAAHRRQPSSRTFHPTFLYESLWDVGVAALVIWADRRFRLGHGRAFALYVAAVHRRPVLDRGAAGRPGTTSWVCGSTTGPACLVGRGRPRATCVRRRPGCARAAETSPGQTPARPRRVSSPLQSVERSPARAPRRHRRLAAPGGVRRDRTGLCRTSPSSPASPEAARGSDAGRLAGLAGLAAEAFPMAAGERHRGRCRRRHAASGHRSPPAEADDGARRFWRRGRTPTRWTGRPAASARPGPGARGAAREELGQRARAPGRPGSAVVARHLRAGRVRARCCRTLGAIGAAPALLLIPAETRPQRRTLGTTAQSHARRPCGGQPGRRRRGRCGRRLRRRSSIPGWLASRLHGAADTVT